MWWLSANLALCLFAGTATAKFSGSSQRSLRVNKDNATRFLPEEKQHFYGNLKCAVTVQIGKDSSKFEMCPEECPYYAQDLADTLHCSFVCVPAYECGVRNPNRPIADVIKGHKTCRGPMVPDCREFNLDGTDTCAKCQWGYDVHTDGQCHFTYWYTVMGLVVVCVVIGLCVAFYLVDLCSRANVNQSGVTIGLNYRSLQKIRTPITAENHKSDIYPINTNLCNVSVGGPGMLLHFNFQAFIIVWAFIIGTIWTCFCVFIDDRLFDLGTKRFGTPRENCILVAYGYNTQQELMWTKVTFLIIAYLFTFAFTFGHAVRQYRLFEAEDSKTKTMKDFMAYLTNLPELDGSDATIEKQLADKVKEATGKEVVGVSIAWNYKEHEDLIQEYLEADMLKRDKKHQGSAWQQVDEAKVAENRNSYGAVRKFFYDQENSLFSDPEPSDLTTVKDIVAGMKSSDNAFVVFHTEEDRNEAIEKSKGSFDFNGNTITMEEKVCEPDTINWEHFGNTSPMLRLKRLIQGFFFIFLALCVWTFVFYAPYAYQVFNFNFDNGAQPPFTLAMTFTMVVVLGNAMMYETCARVSDFIGYKTRDDRESTYLILYVIACMFNFLLDLITTYFMAMRMMEGLGFRNYFGVKLSEIEDFTKQFESYAMQRTLAENTKAYSFPATFLIPFLLEPFIIAIGPFLGGKAIVASHPEWVGRDAERWLGAWEFDMGRYGDLLLNMVLGNMIFFFPGGYTRILFFGMAGSHAYIYLFDHWRVLNVIPKVVYASIDIDWWSNWMMAPITGMIPWCLVFKANCQEYGFCIRGAPLIEAQLIAFFVHVLVHTLMLLYVVPLFKPNMEDANEGEQFSTAATRYAATFFSTNPIHCVRSELLHNEGEGKYCTYYKLGKTHLMNVNEKIGCCYSGEEGEPEDYDVSHSFKQSAKHDDKQ